MDLNHEPTDYESVALTKLSYAPSVYARTILQSAYYSIGLKKFSSI